MYTVNAYTKTNVTGLLDTFKKRDAGPGGPGGPGGGLANIDPSALKNLPPEVRKSLEEQIKQEQQKQKLLQRLQSQSQ